MLTRRETLQVGIGGALGAWTSGCKPASDDVCDAAAQSLIDEPDDPFVPLRAWLEQGASVDALYAAAMSVGARSVDPSEQHYALAVVAAHLMSDRVDRTDELVPLFYTWHMEHRAVVDARGFATPPLPGLDAAALPSADQAAEALEAALIAWDVTAADHAVTALYRAGGRDAVLELVIRYGLRNHVWVGHTAIWTAHALRGLDRFGWGCGEPVMRAIVRNFVFQRESASTSAFDANLLRLGDVPARWRDGRDEPDAVLPLVAILRTGDAATCVDAVLERLGEGVSVRTVWTALAVAAVELSVRWQESSFGVHEVDTLNALRHLQGLTEDADTEVLTLLQAAAWHPEFRAYNDGEPVVAETLDALAPAATPPADLAAVFDALIGGHLEAARLLGAHFDAGGSIDDVIDQWPAIVVRHASGDVHHYKFNVALIEETEAALPEFRRLLLLGITLRGPSTLGPAWERYDEARAIIDAVG